MDLLQQIQLRRLFDPNQPNSFKNEGLNNPLITKDLFKSPAIDDGLIKGKKPPSTPAIISSPLNPPEPKSSTTPYKRPTIDLEAYKKHLEDEPNRQDYQLSKLGKVLAGVAGAAEGWNKGARAGIETTQGLLNRPFQEAQEAYQSKTARLKEKAEMERTLGQEVREDTRWDTEQQWKEKAFNLEELRTKSALDLDKLQGERLAQELKTGGYKVFENKVDGKTYVKDMNNLEAPPMEIGQFALSMEQEDKRTLDNFKATFNVENEARKEAAKLARSHDEKMAARAEAHSARMANISAFNQQVLAEHNRALRILDRKLENEMNAMSVESQKDAYMLAYQQALHKQTGGAEDGEVNPEQLVTDTQENLKKIMDTALGKKEPMANVVDRQMAEQWLKDNDYPVDEVGIKNAMERKPWKAQSTTPPPQSQNQGAPPYITDAFSNLGRLAGGIQAPKIGMNPKQMPAYAAHPNMPSISGAIQGAYGNSPGLIQQNKLRQ